MIQIGIFGICIARYSPQTFIPLCCSVQKMFLNRLTNVAKVKNLTLEQFLKDVCCSVVVNSPLMLLRHFSKFMTSLNINLIAQSTFASKTLWNN